MEDNIRWFHKPSKCHPMHIVQCTVYTIYTQCVCYTIYIIYSIYTMYTQYTQHLSRQCRLHSPPKCHPLHKLNSIVYHLSRFADMTSKCHYTASLHHMYQTLFPDNTPLQDIKVSPPCPSLASAPVYLYLGPCIYAHVVRAMRHTNSALHSNKKTLHAYT